jgi:hypothetical protein
VADGVVYVDFMYWSGSTTATTEVIYDLTGYFIPVVSH